MPPRSLVFLTDDPGYARERLTRGRRIAYGIGRVLCGRRPFAPYLDRNRWNTEWTRPA